MPNFKPEINITSNIRRNVRKNNLITDVALNDSINIKSWMGINETTGNSNLVLAQNGQYVALPTVDFGIIEITKAAMLTAIGASTLQEGYTYKITDIENGLFVKALSANQITKEGTISLFVPDYNASGVNLGQMDANNIPIVGAGEKVIWGDYYWENQTALPVTPTITDSITLTGLTQLTKNATNYDVIDFFCVIDSTLGIGEVHNATTSSFWKFPVMYLAFVSPSILYTHAPLNYSSIINSNLTTIRNYKGDISSNKLCLDFNNFDSVTTTCSGNTGPFVHFAVLGGLNEIKNNNCTGDGQLSTFQITNTSRVIDNSVSGTKVTNNPLIGFITMFDNCDFQRNVVSGDSANIYDIYMGEGCAFNDNVASGNDASLDSMRMFHNDEFSSVTLSGANSVVRMVDQKGQSIITNFTIAGDNWIMEGITQLHSTIDTVSITNGSGKVGWQNINQVDSNITNATDIDINNCDFQGVDINFLGWSRDLTGISIINGKGTFTTSYDFTANPLTSGSSAYLGFLPQNSYITSLCYMNDAMSGGAGATLSLGIESEDPTYAFSSTVLAGITNTCISTVSTKTTANRSLVITGGVDDITSGVFRVTVEFLTH